MKLLKIKKLNKDAKVPKYAHFNDAGIDLYCIKKTTIAPRQRVLVETGIAMQIPLGFAGLIWDKSGLSTKYGLHVFAGVIDATYRGEIKILLYNSSSKAFTFEKGDKISQMLIQPVMNFKIIESNKLSATKRDLGGFGSTGKK